ncbi:MAG: DNA topoisomerase III [Verrucomicrobiota bacterium]
MGKTLVIAEKPSVAGDIARALGKFKKEKDFFENEKYIISSAIGHLISIDAPESDQPKRGKWNLKNLPVIPSQFELRPIEKTEARYRLLKKFIGSKDITSIVNACDAGREGELIFRHIVQLAGTKKPIQRLWLQSMTPSSIRENFEKLLDGKQLEPLADAAMCRCEADWLIGINGTRSLTAFNSLGGGFHKTTVGRVQTPTLTILVERERDIHDFQPRNYWEIHGTFGVKAGSYLGKWFDEKFKKEGDRDLRPERLWNKTKAEKIAQECKGKTGIIEEESKSSQQLSPLLFDLTSLQRDANSKLGFPAKMTLSIAQALYEKHKAITYPRTDSRHLPDDYVRVAKNTMESMKGTPYAEFAQKILKSNWLKPDKRIFNQAKVSDHFAIIPTTETPSKLTDPEQKIYNMIVKRFLAVFYPPALYEITTRITRIAPHAFKTEGKILKDAGWLAVYGKEAENGKDQNGEPANIVPVKPNEKADALAMDIKELLTKPPARFNEATLLSAMEGAGKLVDDEELRHAMASKGLGTPATRAAIIEGLIFENYIVRDGRELVPTAKAFHLLETLRAMNILELTSPELTGEWEYQLKLIEQGKLTRPAFMAEIQKMTRDVVKKVKDMPSEDTVERTLDIKDPFTGENLVETLRDYRSKDGSLIIRKLIASRVLEMEELRQLLAKRTIGPLAGFRSKMGKPFSAYLKLTDEKKVVLDWGNGANGNGNGNGEPAKIVEGSAPLGKCPKGDGQVVETSLGFACEHAVQKGGKCNFRVSKKILSKDITRDDVCKLIQDKKTGLIEGFISNKTKKPFKAFLVLKKDGALGFEFLPSEKKSKKSPAKKTES